MIDTQNAAFGYDGHIVVHSLNFSVQAGDFLLIVGENGSGKSTLVKGLLRLINPIHGTVSFLINKIRDEKIPVVFHIELSNERMADTISAETGAKKLLLHACHNVSKKDFDAGLGYLDFMRGNTERLREALY